MGVLRRIVQVCNSMLVCGDYLGPRYQLYLQRLGWR